MKSLKVLISLALSLAIILSVGTVFAATDLGGGFFGHYLDKSTDISVSDGTLTATQNADTIYNYVADGNIFDNSSFELSDTALNSTVTNGDYSEITTGWIDNQVTPSSKALITMDTDDAHSGKNSLSIKTISGQPRLVSSAFEASDWTIGVDKDKKYTISYWAKGDEFVRVMYWTGTSGNWGTANWSANSSTAVKPGSDWKLFTYEFDSSKMTTYTSGDVSKDVIRLAIHFNGSSSNTIHIDDIVLTTTDQTIVNVEKMIDNLDMSSHNATRAVDDIEQWIAKLGKDNISNYDLFLMKKSGYVYYSEASTLDNTGFEKSDSAAIVKNNTGTFKEITTGWVANYTTATMQTAEISNDAHSGNNALKISVMNNNTEAGKQVYYNLPVYSSNISDSGTPYYQFDKANTKYIVSAWVKGAKLRGGIKLYDEETATWQTATTWQTIMENDAGDKWTLYTFNVTTNSLGQAQWFINVPQVIDSTATVIIDDIQVLTLKDNIKLVDSLIDQLATFDKSSGKYARAKADIEQWLPVLDSADLNLKYDIVLNEKYNIITPNEGYTHLAQGDYIASVTLKGKGEVNRVYGDNITNITSILTELTDEYVTHRKRVTVGAYGTHYMGVQLTNSAAINTVDIKDFSLKRVGDVNESGEIDIRDMVRMAKGLNGTDTTVDALVADYDNSSSFDRDDIAAVRELVLNKDLLS